MLRWASRATAWASRVTRGAPCSRSITLTATGALQALVPGAVDGAEAAAADPFLDPESAQDVLAHHGSSWFGGASPGSCVRVRTHGAAASHDVHTRGRFGIPRRGTRRPGRRRRTGAPEAQGRGAAAATPAVPGSTPDRRRRRPRLPDPARDRVQGLPRGALRPGASQLRLRTSARSCSSPSSAERTSSSCSTARAGRARSTYRTRSCAPRTPPEPCSTGPQSVNVPGQMHDAQAAVTQTLTLRRDALERDRPNVTGSRGERRDRRTRSTTITTAMGSLYASDILWSQIGKPDIKKVLNDEGVDAHSRCRRATSCQPNATRLPRPDHRWSRS